MSDLSRQNTTIRLLPEFDDLELFRANAIHHTYTRHSHPSYAIGIIESGVGGHSYQGETYLIPPQNVVFMNPEEVHTGYSAEGLPLTYRMLYPSVSLIQKIANEVNISGFPYFREAVVENKCLSNNVLALHTALEASHSQFEKQSLLVEILSAILRRYANSKSPSVSEAKEHQAVRLIKEYLHDNFSSHIALENLAKVTHLNRSYLIRVFRQTVGMPPYTYLTQIRVRKAKQFLRQGLSVAETAIAVGMADQSHLTRHFKQILGITPGYYRQMSTSFKTAHS